MDNNSGRMGGYDSRDRGSMNSYNRNDRSGGGGGGGRGGDRDRDRDRNQGRQFMGGSSSTSSYSSSQRYDDDDRSGKGGGRGGSRGGNGGGSMQQQSNRPQGGGGGKGSLHGSKSISESRPMKMEEAPTAATATAASSIQDTDPSDQSFLDLEVSPNILKDVLKKLIDTGAKPEEHNEDLVQLTQKQLMAREDATAVQVVKKTVFDVMVFVMERKEKCRKLCGQLMAHCVNNKFVSRSVFVSSLGQFLVSVEDLIIDVPKVWEYIPEFLGE